MIASKPLVLKRLDIDPATRARVDLLRDLLMDAEDELRKVGPMALQKPDDRGAVYVGAAHDMLRSARYYLEPRDHRPVNGYMAEVYLVLGMAFGAIAAAELVGRGGPVLTLVAAREQAAKRVDAESKRRRSWAEDNWQDGRE